jgi:hypothetical protein
MAFDKFVSMETVSEQRRTAIQQSLQSITVAELRKLVRDLSDFEGDPWQQNFLRVIEAHPQGSFYRAVTQEGITILYCPEEDAGIWVLPGSGMGPMPEEGKQHVREALGLPSSGKKQTRR